MSAVLQKKPPGVIASATHQVKKLNAETVTVIATGFLKRIGHKGGLKPKRVSLEEGIYTVEVEIKKLNALIRIDAENQEIIAYEIQPKGEETSFISFSPKAIMVIVVMIVTVNAALHFAFKFLGL